MNSPLPPPDSDTLPPVDSVNDELQKQSSSENSRVKLKLEDLNWDHSFVRELPCDPLNDIVSREVIFLLLAIKFQNKLINSIVLYNYMLLV